MTPIPEGKTEITLAESPQIAPLGVTETVLAKKLEAVSDEFELEEYRQVLKERQFIMTRFMQAVGLFVTLSGFALKELIDANPVKRILLLAALFTVLNT